MLVGSGIRYGGSPLRYYGQATVTVERSKWGLPGDLRNLNSHSGASHKSGRPDGYLHPGSYCLPDRAGGVSTAQRIAGAGALTGSPAGGVNGEATIAGDSDMTGTGQLLAGAVAALTGSGVISDADAAAYYNAIDAALSGSGGIADADARAILNAAADLVGACDLTAAIDALADIVAALAGVGALTTTGRADAVLEAAITLAATTELSVDSIAAAVWDTPQGELLYALGHNRVVTDPTAGTYTVYAEDDTTVLFTADLWQDADGTTPYAGAGADRRDRLT